MNSLKKSNRKPVAPYRARLIYRLSKKTRLRKPRIEQKNKKNNGVIRKNEIGKKIEIVASLE